MAYDSKQTLNRVFLIGRLGTDPEIKYVPSGAAVLSINVATNTSYKKDGETTDLTEWNRVVAWRKTAEFIAKYAKKGSQIFIEGRLQTRSWDDKNGVKRYTTEVVADNAQLLGSKSESNQSAPEPEEPPEQPVDDYQDDLPF